MGGFLKKNKISILLVFLILSGAFLRFYNLNWGAPFYFHPDERNIASAISQLSFPNQMNPNFFAYGSLPIYAIYLTGVVGNLLFNTHPITTVLFDHAIIISRIYSALFSTLIIPLLFLIGKKMGDDRAGIIASFLATFSIGLIQYAHFGTYEIWLTFFSVLFFLFLLQTFKRNNSYPIFSLAITFGILVAIKISSLAILPIALIIIYFKNRKFAKYTQQSIIFLALSLAIYASTNPYAFLDSASFINSMKYESDVATGALKVFYTGGFDNSTPVIFQFLRVYPFILNPLLTFILIPSFFYLSYKALRTKNVIYLLLNSCFLILFLSQVFLYVKWTRYMIPTLPFIYLIIAITVSNLLQRFKKVFGIKYLVLSILATTSAIFSLSYFITVFVRPDTRIAANEFAGENIPRNTKILSEPYDLGIVPFNKTYSNISIFNFYELDADATEFNTKTLSADLEEFGYIIIPSQRILKSRLLNENTFTNGHKFYSRLIDGELGFKKIYETPCDIFCKITYLGSPVYHLEETASVFDRPTIMIFEKI